MNRSASVSELQNKCVCQWWVFVYFDNLLINNDDWEGKKVKTLTKKRSDVQY